MIIESSKVGREKNIPDTLGKTSTDRCEKKSGI